MDELDRELESLGYQEGVEQRDDQQRLIQLLESFKAEVTYSFCGKCLLANQCLLRFVP